MNRIVATMLALFSLQYASKGIEEECVQLQFYGDILVKIPENAVEKKCPEFNPPVPQSPGEVNVTSLEFKRSRAFPTAELDLITGEELGTKPLMILDIHLASPPGAIYLQKSDSITHPKWETFQIRVTQTGFDRFIVGFSRSEFDRYKLSLNGFIRFVHVTPEEMVKFAERLYYSEDPDYRVYCCGNPTKHWLEMAALCNYEPAHEAAEKMGVRINWLLGSRGSDKFRDRFPLPTWWPTLP